MDIAIQRLRAESHTEIGELIERHVSTLIERWSQRAQDEQPNAQRLHRESILNHLPKFLKQLGRSLAEHGQKNGTRHKEVAAEHGLQRWQYGWSLSELVRDYQLLRLVILEHLESALDRSLTGRESMAVGVSLDDAIASSIEEYVRSCDRYIAQIEQERAAHQKMADEAILKWKHVFQHANWGLALGSAAGETFLEVNAAFAQMHGYAIDELIGKPLEIMFPPEERPHFPKHVLRATELGEYVYESLHMRKDGTRFPVLTSAKLVKDVAGNVLFRASAFQDITHIKELEESLRQQALSLKLSDGALGARSTLI